MNHGQQDPVAEAAIGWIIRISAPDFGDWATFEAWMVADPANSATYWRLAAIDRDIAVLAARVPVPSDAETARVVDIASRRPRPLAALAGWAMAAAAAVALLFFGGQLLRGPASVQVAIETAAGERRVVEMPDGTRIALNGGGRMTYDRDRYRTIRLERGQARFDVRHDSARPFTLQVGEASIADLGTSFDVIREGGETRVAVAEGSVRFARGDTSHDLRPGESLRIADKDTRLILGRVDVATISGWRDGRLVYENIPVSLIADDLGRSVGVKVTVAPDVAARVFTGAISTRGDAKQVLEDAAATIGIAVEQKSDGWILGGEARRTP